MLQLLGSESTSTQVPAQIVFAVGGHWHEPFEQVAPAEHTTPQSPQLSGSAWKSLHPSGHAALPLGQRQLDFVQLDPAGHAVPQNPQLESSDDVSTHALP